MAFHASLEERYGSRVHLTPQDEMGRLDLTSILGTPQKDTLIYCCGPEALLGAVEEASSEWPSGALHVERFAPKEQGEPVLHTSFEVELAQSGLTLTVPVDQSILDVVDAAGVHVLYSCKEAHAEHAKFPSWRHGRSPRQSALRRGAGLDREHVHLRLAGRLPAPRARHLSPPHNGAGDYASQGGSLLHQCGRRTR